MELHTDWDLATAELGKHRESDQAYENAKQIEDTQGIAEARKAREALLIRVSDILAALSVRIE
eukprot:10263623-Prorocentrum_lima.AAC.1